MSVSIPRQHRPSRLAKLTRSPAIAALIIGILLFHLAFLKPVIWGLDGNDVLQVAHSLVTQRSFAVPPDAGAAIGIDGQSYSSRYLLLPLLLTPIVAVSVWLSPFIGLPALQIAAVLAVPLSVVLTAATAALVFLFAQRLGSTPQGAYVAAVGYAFGTIAIAYAQTLFSEPLLGFLTVASLYLAFGTSQKAWWGSSALAALAILTKPTAVIIAPILSLYFLVKRYSPLTIFAPIAMPTLGAIAYGLYNIQRFGDILDTGQPTHYALTADGAWERFFGFLVGPGMGGGLIWYCPPTVLALIGGYKLLKSKPLEALAIALVCLSFVSLHAFWWCCGWDWGPRFLVPILPLLMALCALLDYRARRWLIGLSLLGLAINAPTLVSFYQRYYWEIHTSGQNIWAMSLWTPLADAPFIQAWGAAYRQISDSMATSANEVIAAGKVDGLMQIVPAWWWMLPLVGLPIWLGGGVAIALVVASIYTLYRGWMFLENSPPSHNTTLRP